MTSGLSLSQMAIRRSMSERHPHSSNSTTHASGSTSQASVGADEQELATAISAAILELDASSIGRPCATATTYLDENIVLCVLESSSTAEKDAQISGSCAEVIDRTDASRTAAKADFTGAVERLTHRRVRAAKNSRTKPGVACLLFLLDSAAPTLVGMAGGRPA